MYGCQLKRRPVQAQDPAQSQANGNGAGNGRSGGVRGVAGQLVATGVALCEGEGDVGKRGGGCGVDRRESKDVGK